MTERQVKEKIANAVNAESGETACENPAYPGQNGEGYVEALR
ncbi:MAG: hypothetical protein BWY79_01726 [Actinobacteria bacterium ADurb.Bin444]|nr:MAG: hypothetical protein BWY79_01726 [Actinobacteria bacterium ADurb.Bin444]